MATGIIMPKAGMAMESGVIVSWLKQVGDYVQKGEPVLEVETDKVTMEVEAETSGYLLKILHDEGDEVPVTQVIGYLGEEGEELQEDDAHGASPAAPAAETPTDRDSAAAAPGADGDPAAAPAGGAAPVEAADDQAGTAAPAGDQAAGSGSDSGDQAAGRAEARPRATPKARRLAAEAGIDLSSVAGSGPGGAVQAHDVDTADAPGGRPSAPAAAPGETRAGAAAPAAGTTPAGATRRPLSRLRRTIARNMAASHAAVPAVTLNAEADVTELLVRREALPAGRGEATGGAGDSSSPGGDDGRSRPAGTGPRPTVRPSVNDLVVYAVSRVLPEHPQVNAHLDGEELLLFESVNLGVAVAVDDGLVVPVITGAAERDLADLATEGRRLAEAARAGLLKLEELEGATFSVTNLGMFGVTSFNPIINLPQVGILGIGTATPRLARKGDGEIVERRFMTLSFTFDHRAMDGAGAARFLQDVCSRLEQADGIIPADGPARGVPTRGAAAGRKVDSPNAKDTI